MNLPSYTCKQTVENFRLSLVQSNYLGWKKEDILISEISENGKYLIVRKKEVPN